MNILQVIPGIGEGLRRHFRPSKEEPRDISFCMTFTVFLAAWFFVVTMSIILPAGSILWIVGQFTGPITWADLILILYFIGLGIYLIVLIFFARWAVLRWTKARKASNSVIELVTKIEDHYLELLSTRNFDDDEE